MRSQGGERSCWGQQGQRSVCVRDRWACPVADGPVYWLLWVRLLICGSVCWLVGPLVATGSVCMFSVPARLAKGQVAKEIGHNLTRERHKIGAQFSAQTTQNRAQFCGRLMKTWAQICKHVQTFLHQLSENRKTANTFCKQQKIEKCI